MSDNEKQAAARIPEDKYNQLKAQAALEGMTLADWLREAIDEKWERECEGNSDSAPKAAA